MLESYNIKTAWDVSEQQVMRVPGFGPALTRELLGWRAKLETKFKFDPSKGINPQDIAALDRDIADMKRKLEASLSNGPQALTQIISHILMQRQILKPQLDEAAGVGASASRPKGRMKCKNPQLIL
jgi:DNA-binding helix-hairpin-helix protein with protein kinase domain